MRIIGYLSMACALAVWLALAGFAGATELPPALQRGINITNWFRFPPSGEPAALRAYLSDAALRELKRVGFSFIRLPVQPELLATPEALSDAISRVQRAGLAIIVVLFAADWHLERSADDRDRLLATWHSLASMLRRFDPTRTFPEILNEPVFPHASQQWEELQHRALLAIRPALPTNTVVLSGNNWGSVSGLLSMTGEADPNVVYSFHFYEPAELTALGAYRAGLDAAAMARLPFPTGEPSRCRASASSVHDEPTADLMHFYCAEGWDEAKLAARIASAGAWGRTHHVSVIAGEFGASQRLNQRSRLAWLGTVRLQSEQQGIGWALWGYDDSMGFGLHPPHERWPLDPMILKALGLAGALSSK